MNEQIDFKKINETTDLVKLIGGAIPLTKKGQEYKGVCPFHDDKKASLGVRPDKQLWKCLACGEGSSALDFVMKYNNVDVKEAAKIIASDSALTNNAVTIEAQAPKAPKWDYRKHLSEDSPKPDFKHYKHGEPSGVWRYNDTFYVLRYDTKDGKEVVPYTLCIQDGVEKWKFKGHPRPRPLYNLKRIEADKKASIIIVEGEKTAEALQQVLPSFIVTTWVGGANGVINCDFDPLIDRKKIYWPDHDWQGHAAAHYIHLVTGGQSKYIGAPKDAPEHWDFADTGWNEEQTKAFIKANKYEFQHWTTPKEWINDADRAIHFNLHGKEGALKIKGDRITTYPKPPEKKTKPEPTPPAPVAPEPEPHKGAYYRHLGYAMNSNGSVEHFVYDDRAKKVHTFTPSKLTKLNLMQIAPLNHWESRHPGAKGGVDWDQAADAFTDISIRSGLYNVDRIRGRGAWMDESRIVIHAGSHLIVDGRTIPTDQLASKYIYQLDHETGFAVGSPLLKRESSRLIDALKLVSWQRPVNAYLLAGWLVLAPIGGVLDWRPHVWVTGPRGAGKTWIKREIIDRVLGDATVNAIGETTEAGLRQTLASDALPVVFDEIDSDTKKDNERIEQIMTLMRIASSESGSKVYKGTTAHQSRSFNIRSCFCFLSIVYQAMRAADLSRITLLTLNEDNSTAQAKRFVELQGIVKDEMTEDWVRGLRARTLKLLPVIIENIAVFERAGRKILQSSRARDQVAPLAAAAYSLVSDEVIEQKDAEKWLLQHEWSDEISSEEINDEQKCLDKIMQNIVRVELGEDYPRTVERSVGELISNCMGGGGADVHGSEMRLLRLGIKIEGGTFIISNTADGIKNILRDTPWSKSHGKVLSRIPGSAPTPHTTFAKGHRSRGVIIKWDDALG